MENFQLYKTNLLLGGQLKWDLILENDSNKLYIKDANITPISNNIPYTYKYNDALLNNDHHENIKLFYKNIEGYFYDEGLDMMFNNSWPTIVKKDEVITPYSNIYDMGCKRSKNYRRYNKQFEFFCPLWIEKMSESLVFKITVKGKDSDAILATHTINVLAKDGHKKHDMFVNYLKNHINYVGIDKGTNKVLTVKFNDQSYATGIDAKTGLKCIRNVSNVINNMITRERPVIETDNMLMNCFSNNHIICNQLFNFNICFNIDDVMSSTTAKLLKGKPLNISVDVYIDGIELEKRDFYCNYDFIEKEKYYDGTNLLSLDELDICKTNYPQVFDKFNIFDHLHDNDYIETINVNKYCQKICHWCLADNPDYLFNLYRGFDGYSITFDNSNRTKPIIVENEHQYGSTPNTTIYDYSLSSNNTGWINYEEVIYWNKFYNYMLNTEKYKNTTPIYLNNQQYINGLKYDYVPNGIYLLGIKTTSKLFSAISNTYKDSIDWLDKNLGVLILDVDNDNDDSKKDKLMMLITYNWNYLTFATVHKILYTLNKHNWETTDAEGNTIKLLRDNYLQYIIQLYKMMRSVKTPSIISLGGNLEWEYVKGPNKEVKEVTYYKDGTTDYVFRYDGNIKPYFIKDTDILYYKDYLSDDRKEGLSTLQKSIYAKYAYSNFEPNYPSIGYSACKKVPDYNREDIPTIYISEHGNIPLINTVEYSWFNNGISIYVLPELKFTYLNKKQNDGSYKSVKNIVIELLKDYYNVEDKILDTIVDMYSIKSDWEYASDTNIDDYLYKIELTLK